MSRIFVHRLITIRTDVLSRWWTAPPVRQSDPVTTAAPPGDPGAPGRFPVDLMVAASTLYYLQDATQAEVAQRLQTSRATVSRLLSEARRLGIVNIEVRRPSPAPDDVDLPARAAAATGLTRVYVATAAGRGPGAALAPALSLALTDVGLGAGNVLLVSSGRAVYEAAQAELPSLPGVLVVPTIGGQAEPEPWYQTNEITREFAAKIGGRPMFLYAPALPGAELHRSLLEDASTQRILELWQSAACAVLGVGAPPLTRQSIPGFVPTDATSLRYAVGDVCSRFYDARGVEVPFPGSDRLMATALDVVRQIPFGIAVAYGAEKVSGIVAGARAGYFNRLVTDAATATLLAAT